MQVVPYIEESNQEIIQEKKSIYEVTKNIADDSFYQLVPLNIDKETSIKFDDVLQFRRVPLKLADDHDTQLIIIKNFKDILNLEQCELENRLYELFTATMSHEMKTPLNSILTLIKILMSTY